MQILRVNGVSSHRSNATNFSSRVIYTDSEVSVPQNVKDFIDKFEDSCPKGNDGARLQKDQSFAYGNFAVSDIKDGESANVYIVKEKKGWFDRLFSADLFPVKFAVKESKPLKYKTRKEGDWGDLKHEYNMDNQIYPIDKQNIQRPLAYLKTEDDSRFMLSEFMENTKKIGLSSSTAEGDIPDAMINHEYLTSALDTLAEFDAKGYFNPDLTRGNVVFNTSNQKANFMDFQWAHRSYYYSSPSPKETFAFARDENINNIAPFEANVVADHLVGLEKDKKNRFSKSQIRNVLKDYLQVRSDYAPRSNDFDISIFKNPSDDILDAELLRLAFLRNHRMQFLYTDDNIERPRNMMKLVGYSAMASYAAKALANFQPKNPPRNSEEEKYFNFMRNYGRDMHEKTSEWYPSTVNWLKRVARGWDSAPGRYFPNLFEPAELDSTNSHFRLLSDNSQALVDWSTVEGDLSDNVHTIEKSLSKLSKGNTSGFSYYEFQNMVDKLYR